MYSLFQRLRSLRHGFWYGISERIRWSCGAYQETPAREPGTLEREQAERIAALGNRYQVQSEQRMSAATGTNNYEYPRSGHHFDVAAAAFASGPRQVVSTHST